ncbi:hypothetical protein HYT23_01900 [Candidatus Pacearchaeota archaeon]|nr:hypothetical protein [Candidatus Pacearchaeota archaeon]
MTLEQDAKEVREKLKFKLKEAGFPNKYCKFAVLEINKRGYEIIAGTVKVDNYCGMLDYYEWPHYWNFDRVTGMEFDITASQFNIHTKSRKFPEIAVWKPGENPAFSAVKRGISPDYVF